MLLSWLQTEAGFVRGCRWSIMGAAWRATCWHSWAKIDLRVASDQKWITLPTSQADHFSPEGRVSANQRWLHAFFVTCLILDFRHSWIIGRREWAFEEVLIYTTVDFAHASVTLWLPEPALMREKANTTVAGRGNQPREPRFIVKRGNYCTPQ